MIKAVGIIGVIQDSVETALNSSGDVFFTATAEECGRKKKGIRAAKMPLNETTGMIFRTMNDVLTPNEIRG